MPSGGTAPQCYSDCEDGLGELTEVERGAVADGSYNLVELASCCSPAKITQIAKKLAAGIQPAVSFDGLKSSRSATIRCRRASHSWTNEGTSRRSPISGWLT